ncbi:MAG: flagellar hook-associated protein FlgK, partial [Brevibacillus sp.]
MRSTFHGLEVSKRGLIAQQAALNTTGHNIANANTEGYTRQRVNMVATTGIPYVGLNMSREAGLLGTGVMVSDIQRLREDFLDLQFRNENKILGYWDERVDALAKIEAILQEPSETGLQKVMDQMWQAWQDLSKDPINPSTRAVVRERSIAVAETFANLYKQLQQIQQDMDHVIGVKALEVNSLAQQIAAVNKMINDVVPHGYVPNDLYDQRDVLIDKLSKLVPVKVSYV